MSTITLLQGLEVGSWHLNQICLDGVHCTHCSGCYTFSLRGRTVFHPSEVGKVRTSLLRKVMKRNGALLYPAKAAVVKRSLEVALTEDDFAFPFPTITTALGTESI